MLMLGASLAGCGTGLPGAGGGGGGGGRVSGRIVDPSGNPVVGALVSAGGTAVLTDASGSFSLIAPDGVLTVRKVRYQTTSLTLQGAPPPPWTLLPASASVTVDWDERWGSLAQTQGIRQDLASHGFDVQLVGGGSLPPADEVVVPVPAAISASGVAELTDYVKQGGKLVLLGAWGGYPQQDLTDLDALSEGAGIQFDTVTLMDYQAQGSRPEWISIAELAPSLAQGVAGALFFTPNRLLLSKDGAGNPALPLAVTADQVSAVGGERWATGSQVVVAVGTFGDGEILAVSDTSWLTDDDTSGNGTPDWQVEGNARLAENLLNW